MDTFYGDYRELLTGILMPWTLAHSRSLARAGSLAAIKAGKDVYLQKPMTMTYEEGVFSATPSKKSDRIFRFGSQQRSWGPNEQFPQIAGSCGVVAGQLKAVEIGLPTDPTKPDDPEQPVPSNLNYDMWLGRRQVYYTEQRVHSHDRCQFPPGLVAP